MQKHTLPVHLETQDKLVFGLMTRQVMVLALGVTLSYSIWSSLPTQTMLELAISLALAAIPTVLALLVAFLRPSGQGLDDWCVIGLFYVMTPKTYLWAPLTSQDNGIEREQAEMPKDLLEEEEE